MSAITNAKADLETARTKLAGVVKEAIAEGLLVAFATPETKNVVFGVSTDPYNDENSGQGTFGPIRNALDDDAEFTRDDEYALFYDNRGASGDQHTRDLAAALNEAGWEAVADALGVSYYPGEGHGSTSAFIASRKADGSYGLYDHTIDY